VGVNTPCRIRLVAATIEAGACEPWLARSSRFEAEVPYGATVARRIELL